MNTTEVMMVRIYLAEGEGQLKNLIKRLHDWEKLRGLTVFRGITGYGEDGVIHGLELLDLSLNLPVVVEFFDSAEKVEKVLSHLGDIIKPGHMVTWTANINQ
ncbi:MAG: DUF190 domain-containing protein [Gammaproteobacteria bacterium]|nr:DUF190 domain-containing protein [Gammaproteobacteria bacterium]